MSHKDAKDTKDPQRDLEGFAHSVIGAAIEVHRHLGPGYAEAVYERALALELRLRWIPFQQQVVLPVFYKGERVGEGRMDLLVGERLVVELKAVDALMPVHTAQTLSYLTAMHLELGLLLNFNTPSMRFGIRRVIRNHQEPL